MPSLSRVSHVGAYTMDVTDVVDFFIKLGKLFLCWAALHQIFRVVAHRCIPRPRNAAEVDVKLSIPKHFLGIAHAVVLSIYGTWIFACLAPFEREDMYFLRRNRGLTPGQIDCLELANWLFFSYLVHDLALMFLHYPKLGGADMIAHHLVFAGASVLGGASQTMMLPLGWLLMGEFSTPLLAIRKLIQSATYEVKSTRVVDLARRLGCPIDASNAVFSAGRQLEYRIGIAFVVVFTLVRVIIYTFGFIALVFAWRDGILMQVPPFTRRAFLVLAAAGLLINYHWWAIMISKVLRGPPQTVDKAEKDH